MKKNKLNLVFKFLKLIERTAARLQGKGYGSATIEKEISCLSNLLSIKPKFALDIGGNVGSYTAELINKWSDITVHIFEPSPTNLPKLKARFLNNNNVIIHPYAVSNFEGKTILYADKPGSGMGSLSHRDLNHLGITNFNNTEEINVVIGEDYWKKIGGGEVNIIKLDIEGHELSALKGLGEIINDVNIIQFEFGGCNIDTGTYFKNFYDFFIEKKFKLYRITPLGVEYISKYREVDEFFSTTNFIALNTNK
jgi:FkbM family methyltransferase